MDIDKTFAKRRKALRKGENVYVGYDEYERVYKITPAPYNGVRVYFKERDGRTGTLNYNISEDAKEALFRGWDITEEEFENCIYEMPDEYYKTYFSGSKRENVINLPLKRKLAEQIVKGKVKEVFFPFNEKNMLRFCVCLKNKDGIQCPWNTKFFDKIHFEGRDKNWYLDVKPGMHGLYYVNGDELIPYPYTDIELPKEKLIFMFKIYQVLDTNL